MRVKIRSVSACAGAPLTRSARPSNPECDGTHGLVHSLPDGHCLFAEWGDFTDVDYFVYRASSNEQCAVIVYAQNRVRPFTRLPQLTLLPWDRIHDFIANLVVVCDARSVFPFVVTVDLGLSVFPDLSWDR